MSSRSLTARAASTWELQSNDRDRSLLGEAAAMMWKTGVEKVAEVENGTGKREEGISGVAARKEGGETETLSLDTTRPSNPETTFRTQSALCASAASTTSSKLQSYSPVDTHSAWNAWRAST